MEQRKPPQYILEVFADPTCIKDIVRGGRNSCEKRGEIADQSRHTPYDLLPSLLSLHQTFISGSPRIHPASCRGPRARDVDRYARWAADKTTVIYVVAQKQRTGITGSRVLREEEKESRWLELVYRWCEGR